MISIIKCLIITIAWNKIVLEKNETKKEKEKEFATSEITEIEEHYVLEILMRKESKELERKIELQNLLIDAILSLTLLLLLLCLIIIIIIVITIINIIYFSHTSGSCDKFSATT